MRVRLIYRKDLHTSEVGVIELDSPGPLVAVHTDGGMGTPLADGSCVVYGLSYHCHEQRCKCGDGDKLSLVSQGANDKLSLDARVPDHLKPVVDLPDRVRTLGECVAAASDCKCGALAQMGHSLDRQIVGAEAVGTVYDEKADIEKHEPEPVEPIKSKSVKKRIAAQSRGRAARTKAKR